LEVLAQRGAQHEQGYIDHLKANGLSVTATDGVGVDSSVVTQTLEAMKAGAQIIVQGALQFAMPEADSAVTEVRAAAQALGHELLVADASSEREIDAAFAMLAQRRIGALFVGNDVFFYSRREQIVALAARHAIPAIYVVREYAQAGGLMSYGTDVNDAQRLAGTYVGRILQGAKPADLPVLQAVKVELVLNMKTAKTLGITFPLSLLGRADEVIE
jgi:putative tryptophan/tyrosine transport system substrate-binding protein